MPRSRPVAIGELPALHTAPQHPGRLRASGDRPHQRASDRRPPLGEARRPDRPRRTSPAPPASELPRICRQPTITLHPGDLGKLDKFRQDRHYLSPAWHDAYRPVRANNEGLNGRAKGHRIDISEPKKRLAHGRTAQTILVALMICMINLQILDDWHRTTGEQSPETDYLAEDGEDLTPVTDTPNGRPPPNS
ncbi:hypothetical protein [Kitasatospora sp. NPDC059673]|uniref:hypothetical protein n=1 Tax=Kitasatospora sp. NPDC059673 TaxID=3346901 RepID=UPI0036A5E742